MSRPVVLQLSRRLESVPATAPSGASSLRTFRESRDIPAWLDLRHRAFADQRPSGREWSEADFQREFFRQPWWNPQRMWVIDDPQQQGQLVGAITLALRGRPDGQLPAIHWLMVDPDCRGQGLAIRLIATLEAAAWSDGHREVVLETHANWKAAVGLYRKLGYAQNQMRVVDVD